MAVPELPKTAIALVGEPGAATLMQVTITDWFNTVNSEFFGREVCEDGTIVWDDGDNRQRIPRGKSFMRRLGTGIKWNRIARHDVWSVHAGTNSNGVCARFMLSVYCYRDNTNNTHIYDYKPGDLMYRLRFGYWIHDIDIVTLSKSPKLRATACDYLVSAAVIDDAVAEEDVKYDDDAGDDDTGDEYPFCAYKPFEIMYQSILPSWPTLNCPRPLSRLSASLAPLRSCPLPSRTGSIPLVPLSTFV